MPKIFGLWGDTGGDTGGDDATMITDDVMDGGTFGDDTATIIYRNNRRG